MFTRKIVTEGLHRHICGCRWRIGDSIELVFPVLPFTENFGRASLISVLLVRRRFKSNAWYFGATQIANSDRRLRRGSSARSEDLRHDVAIARDRHENRRRREHANLRTRDLLGDHRGDKGIGLVCRNKAGRAGIARLVVSENSNVGLTRHFELGLGSPHGAGCLGAGCPVWEGEEQRQGAIMPSDSLIGSITEV